jgi:hypothetical protein
MKIGRWFWLAALGVSASALAQTTPPPPPPVPTIPTFTWTLPITFSVIFDVRETNHKLEFTKAIGGVGTDLWQTPLGLHGLYFGQSAWVGAQINGGAATGSGFGLFYVPPKGMFSSLRFDLTAGVDAVAGETPGGYASFTVNGPLTIKI